MSPVRFSALGPARDIVDASRCGRNTTLVGGGCEFNCAADNDIVVLVRSWVATGPFNSSAALVECHVRKLGGDGECTVSAILYCCRQA